MPGDAVSLDYSVGHVGDAENGTNFQTPLVQWLKDGAPTMHNPTNMPMENGRLSTSLSFVVGETDGGVYQCVFTDNKLSEVLITGPIRIDIGKFLSTAILIIFYHFLSLIGEAPSIERVSPPSIILNPPEKLVLEVQTSGRFLFTQWQRNGDMAAGLGSFQPGDENFAHFTEVYTSKPTTDADLGVYEITALRGSGQTLEPGSITIVVIQFGKKIHAVIVQPPLPQQQQQ